MPLTHEQIENRAGRDKPYKAHDGAGMFVVVTPSGAKWRRIKFRLRGKHKQLSLGVHSAVSLPEARLRCAAMRKLLADGIDPSATGKAERAAIVAEELAQATPPRFAMDNNGALRLCIGGERLALNPAETPELRVFLAATRTVTAKEAPCL